MVLDEGEPREETTAESDKRAIDTLRRGLLLLVHAGTVLLPAYSDFPLSEELAAELEHAAGWLDDQEASL